MEEGPPSAEVLSVVAKRVDVLRALAAGPRDVRDLRDDLGASRSTVYKAVRQLESARVVASTGDGYALTLFGRLLFRTFERTLAETRTLCETEAVLSTLPPTLPIDPSVFADATVVTPGPYAPDRPVDELESFVAELGRFRTLTPVARARYLAFATDRLDDPEFGGEFVVERSVVEYALSTYPEAFYRIAERDSFTYFETTEEIPFGLVLPASSAAPVGVTLYDRSQQLRAFVRTDDPHAAAWAEETYAEFRAAATPLSPADDAEP